MWKEFHYPASIIDVYSYLIEKNVELIKVLDSGILKFELPKNQPQSSGYQHFRHKPHFIDALMSEREQLLVFKSWVENIVPPINSIKDRIEKVKSVYLIITFVLSELSDQMRNQSSVRGEIMDKVKG